MPEAFFEDVGLGMKLSALLWQPDHGHGGAMIDHQTCA